MAPIVGLRPTSPQRGGRDADRASAVACCCQPATYLPPELPLSRRSNRPETTPCPTGFALVQIVDCPCIPRMRIGRGCLPTARWRLPFQAPRAQIIALRGASAKSSDPIPSLHPGRVLGVLHEKRDARERSERVASANSSIHIRGCLEHLFSARSATPRSARHLSSRSGQSMLRQVDRGDPLTTDRGCQIKQHGSVVQEVVPELQGLVSLRVRHHSESS